MVSVIEVIPFPGWAALEGQPNLKWKRLSYALQVSCDFVRQLLLATPDHPEYAECLVDVKIQNLKAGEYPCLPFWHIDFVPTPETPGKPETHYIYQIGAECPTEIQQPGGSSFLVPPETIVEYHRDLHRCSAAGIDGPRLLVRKSWTDVAKPRP